MKCLLQTNWHADSITQDFVNDHFATWSEWKRVVKNPLHRCIVCNVELEMLNRKGRPPKTSRVVKLNLLSDLIRFFEKCFPVYGCEFWILNFMYMHTAVWIYLLVDCRSYVSTLCVELFFFFYISTLYVWGLYIFAYWICISTSVWAALFCIYHCVIFFLKSLR